MTYMHIDWYNITQGFTKGEGVHVGNFPRIPKLYTEYQVTGTFTSATYMYTCVCRPQKPRGTEIHVNRLHTHSQGFIQEFCWEGGGEQIV